MFHFPRYIKPLSFIASVLALSLSLAYLVLAWTEPTVNPPNPDPNVFIPLNTGSTGQSKQGWLGIGASFAPAMPLDIRGSTAESFWVRNGTTYFFAGADNTNKRARIGAYEEGVGWKNLIINEGGGNVGIGTTGPGAKLSLYGNNGVNTPMFEMYTKQTGTASFQRIAALCPTGSSVNDGYFQLSDNGTVTVNIAANNARGGNTYFNAGGNVGIGTTSPGAKLTVAGTIESTSGGIKFPDGSVQDKAAGGGITIANKNAPDGYVGMDSSGLPQVSYWRKIASANTRNSHDAQASVFGGGWQKIKTITINQKIVGSIRIYFEAWQRYMSNGYSWARIYKNGAPWGTQRNYQTASPVGISEDFSSLNLPVGTTIEIYGGGAQYGSEWNYIQNFRLQYDTDINTDTTISASNS